MDQDELTEYLQLLTPAKLIHLVGRLEPESVKMIFLELCSSGEVFKTPTKHSRFNLTRSFVNQKIIVSAQYLEVWV